MAIIPPRRDEIFDEFKDPTLRLMKFFEAISVESNQLSVVIDGGEIQAPIDPRTLASQKKINEVARSLEDESAYLEAKMSKQRENLVTEDEMVDYLMAQIVTLRSHIERNAKTNYEEMIEMLLGQMNVLRSEIEKRTRWAGYYDPTHWYEKNDMTYFDGWTSVALRKTQQEPHPFGIGANAFLLPEAPLWITPSNNSVVHSGFEMTLTQPIRTFEIRVWAPVLNANTNYRVIIVDITNPAAPVTNIIEEPVLNLNQWTTIAFGSGIQLSGSVFQVVLDALETSSSTIYSHEWTYAGSDNNATPALGEWYKQNNNTNIRINKEDNTATDRAAELLAVTPNSIIRTSDTADLTSYWEWNVTSVTDNGTYVTYGTNLIDTGPGGGLSTGANTLIRFDVPIPAPTSYVELQNYWPSNQPNWANVNGYLSYDSVVQGGVADHAFGIDLRAQEQDVPTDWEFITYSSDLERGL